MSKNGLKANGTQNFYCHPCHKQFQFAHQYKGADPGIKRQVRCMSFNGSGIRDIQRVLGVSIAGILMILRVWFKTLKESLVEGHFKRVQIDWASPTKCGLLSNIENKVKDGFGGRRCGMPMTQILVKHWLFISENVMIQHIRP